ncbi:MAG TPA: protein kinase, partial [Gemmatimonadales bacterium]
MTDTFERLRRALDGRYRLEREVGQGGMAIVYLAQDLKHGRQVAIKTLRPELGMALGADRFLREIEIAARLQHPHILPVYDSGQADGVLYYVMPFVEGESLRDRLTREHQLPVAEAVCPGARRYGGRADRVSPGRPRHRVSRRTHRPETLRLGPRPGRTAADPRRHPAPRP